MYKLVETIMYERTLNKKESDKFEKQDWLTTSHWSEKEKEESGYVKLTLHQYKSTILCDSCWAISFVKKKKL